MKLKPRRSVLLMSLLSCAAIADDAATVAPAAPAAAAESAAPAACVGADAVSTARWLYTNRDALYGVDGPMDKVMSDALGAALHREQDCVRRTDEVCALDADLWTNAQEGVMLEPVRYEELEHTDTTALVRVRYRFSLWEDGRDAEPAATQVRLVRADAQACWKLDDLIGAAGVSLRALLATNP